MLCDGFIERTVVSYRGLSVPALLPVADVKAVLCRWPVHRRQVNLLKPWIVSDEREICEERIDVKGSAEEKENACLSSTCS